MSFGICVLVHTLCSSQMFQPLYTFQNQLVYTVYMCRFFTIPNSALNEGFGEKIPALNLNKQTHITWMSRISQQFLFCFVNSKSLKADHSILIVKDWPHLQMSSGWANSLLALAWSPVLDLRPHDSSSAALSSSSGSSSGQTTRCLNQFYSCWRPSLFCWDLGCTHSA